MYDIAIIGSGPAGYVAGIRGAQLGKSVCIIEKGEIGGVCLNKGCIPTKAIIASISILRHITTAERFGVNVRTPQIDFTKIMDRKENIVKKLTSGVKFLLKQNGVEVLSGVANIKEPGCLKIGAKETRAKSIIICTGSSPFIPFEINNKNIVTSDEALNFESLPSRILIIGAGAVGVEFATIFCGLGTKVTLVEMLPSILPEIKDAKITEIVRKELETQGIEIIEGNKVEEISVGNRHVCSLLSSGKEIISDKVIVACGRILNSGGFENLRLEIKDKKIVVDNMMQTNIPEIYAAGDVAGPPLLAHKASVEAIVAVENAAKGIFSLRLSEVGVGGEGFALEGSSPKGIPATMDYSSIPSCIFSNPEIAWVGKFESEVHEARVGEYRFQGIGKALCIDETLGFAKVVADKDYRIKGIQIIGPHASDLIPIGIIGVKKGLYVEELANLIYPHPTLSECLKEALLDVTHSAIHK